MTMLPPRNGDDRERWDRIRGGDAEALAPLVPELLEWLREPESPEASLAAEALLRCADELVPFVQAVLRGRDAAWKAGVIERLVLRLPKDDVLELAPDLLAIAMNPSDPELELEVDELAERAVASALG